MQILSTMTVREAAVLWEDPRSILLKWWAESFDLALHEFRYRHIVAYEQERLTENVGYPLVWNEVCALHALLKHVGLGPEIESHYMTPLERVKLTEEERDRLSPRVRAYIECLEQEVDSLNAANERTKSTLRKINWGGRR
jgi:hypothetical protein